MRATGDLWLEAKTRGTATNKNLLIRLDEPALHVVAAEVCCLTTLKFRAVNFASASVARQFPCDAQTAWRLGDLLKPLHACGPSLTLLAPFSF